MTCVSCGAPVTGGTVCSHCGTPAPGGYGQPAPGGYAQPAPGGYAQPAPAGYGQPDPNAYGYGTPHTAYGMFNTPQIPTPAGLNPGQAIARVLGHYATFKGRASRSEFWWWTLIQALAIFVPVIVVAIATAGSNDSGAEVLQGVTGLWVAVVVLGTLVPTIAVTVRRLHDMGQTGWLYLLVFIPSFGSLALLILCALNSQPVGNQYGLAPVGSKPPFQL